MFHPSGLQPGAVFAGDFRILGPLAMGGMGAVYVVEQLSTGRRRALKLLLPSLTPNPLARERFVQEARVSSHIASDHVVEVVGAGIDAESDSPWIAMELLEGETLAERLERTGALPAAEVLEVFRQLCHALGAAHASGLVHRDIKPENLFLAAPRRDGVPFTLKILDFGIAKLNESVKSTGGVTNAAGSPLWMAPEQTESGAVLPATDVWALGLVAFQCLTGRSYWRTANTADGTFSTLFREVIVEPLEPASVRAQALGAAPLPPGFDEWFARAVNRDVSARWADASQALAALTETLSPTAGPMATMGSVPVLSSSHYEPVHPHKAAPAKRSWLVAGIILVVSAVVLLAGGIVVVAGGVAGGILFWSTSSAPAAPDPQRSDTTAAPPISTAEAPASSASTAAGTKSKPRTTAPRATAPAPTNTHIPPPSPTSTPIVPEVSVEVPVVAVPVLKSRKMTCKKLDVSKSCTSCCLAGDVMQPYPSCECFFKVPAAAP